jgi:hypothetical protein
MRPARGNAHVHVDTVSRRDHLHEFERDFRPGQHATWLGPTGRGKSTLCYQCMQRVVSPDLQVISLHGKIGGRDPVIARAAHQCRLRVVSTIPDATRRKFDRKRKYNGYLLVPLPKPGASATEEEKTLRREFGRAIHLNYANTGAKTITHVNEAHQAQEELKLKKELEAPLMRGGPDNAEWNEAQRGRYLSYHTYGAAEHMWIFYDDDKDTRARYGDFGAADPEVMEDITRNLKTARSADGRTISQCLYLRRGGGMYVVDT